MSISWSDTAKALAKGPVTISLMYDSKGHPYEVLGSGGTDPSTFSLPVSLVLFGAGHIAKELCLLARRAGMEVYVLDDREAELTKDEFKEAHRIHCYFKSFPDDKLLKVSNAYQCIFTHGHQFDTTCLAWCAAHPGAYTGMIGSRRKIQACFDQLRAAGVSDAFLSKVHSPIGLEINAVTPFEIAIAIMAEIISVFRADKSTVILQPDMLDELAKADDATIVRVLSAEGSSPARQGAIMIVRRDSVIGTVGGGALEQLAIDEARACQEAMVKDYRLDEKGTGMACGGSARLLFTPPALS